MKAHFAATDVRHVAGTEYLTLKVVEWLRPTGEVLGESGEREMVACQPKHPDAEPHNATGVDCVLLLAKPSGFAVGDWVTLDMRKSM